MKISTRGRYAVMAMADMAQQAKKGADAPISLADISARQEISLNYLEQIFGDLRRADLVESRRGKMGGYLLAAPLDAIRIGDVIRAVDEPVEVTRCGSAAGCLKKSGRCLTHDLWAHLGGTIHTFLNSISLDDLVDGRMPQVLEAAE
ncbi:MAG: RrF2 family transcriptional regulator [Alphaproteobacteria bacterium]|nr:RrF2 family transcriptional regulator [Alphaproteobacteria bacterium]